MHLTRRRFVRLAALMGAACRFAPAMAQPQLLDQVRVLVGFPPGGGTDTAARRVADGLRGTYARAALVENRPGASGRLAVEELRRGPADGSLLVVQPDSVVTQQPHVDPRNTRYRLEDLAPVASIVVFHHALAVGPLVPDSVRSMKDFLAWTKAHPAQAFYGSPGANSTQEFVMKAAMKQHGFTLAHIPYKGSAAGMQDLLGGQVAAMFSPVGDSLPYLADGKIRILGTSGERRSRFTPDVPTFKEQGLQGMELAEHFGVWATAEVPQATLDRLHAAVQKTIADKDLADFFAKVGLEVDPMSRKAFASAARASADSWRERLRVTGFKPE